MKAVAIKKDQTRDKAIADFQAMGTLRCDVCGEDFVICHRRLLIGQGYVENVEPAVWLYEVSGKQVLLHWFSYRRKNRERPIIGDRRRPSTLGDIQPDHWLPAGALEHPPKEKKKPRKKKNEPGLFDSRSEHQA